jgi:hypothetical protein
MIDDFVNTNKDIYYWVPKKLFENITKSNNFKIEKIEDTLCCLKTSEDYDKAMNMK